MNSTRPIQWTNLLEHLSQALAGRTWSAFVRRPRTPHADTIRPLPSAFEEFEASAVRDGLLGGRDLCL